MGYKAVTRQLQLRRRWRWARAAPLRCLLRLPVWIWFCVSREEGTACTSLIAG